MQHQDHIHFHLMTCKGEHVTVRVTLFLKDGFFQLFPSFPFLKQNSLDTLPSCVGIQQETFIAH